MRFTLVLRLIAGCLLWAGVASVQPFGQLVSQTPGVVEDESPAAGQ